jgi:predicted ferric reductase
MMKLYCRIVIITVGVGTPVLMSLLGHLPFVTGILEKANPYLVHPSTIRTYNVQTLPYMLGNAPTMGQGLYIVMFIILNILLSAVSYKGFGQPDPWGFTRREEILAYVGYRTGHISFALLPLTVLFSSRNNFLLWITNWPFSTFLVLHRWVARICTVQAIVHSITLLATYVGTGTYYTDVHKPYWIWGIVATLCLVILLAQSVAWFRRASYEIFLILHVLLAVFTIAGCWYHVYYWKGLTGIYEIWIYMVSAVWFFDRLIRSLRVAKNGILRATVTELSPDTVRVDVPGLRWLSKPGQHAYIYFPTLKPIRGWENHPFSITHTALLHSQIPGHVGSGGSIQGRSLDSNDLEEGIKTPRETVVHQPVGADSITIYIKKQTGMTSLLRNRTGLPVLLDGPYGGNSIDEVLKCDRVLLIGGGIGITGLLPWIHAHANVKLAWSAKQSAEPIMRDLAAALASVSDKEIRLGERLDVNALLAQEVQLGWKKVGVVVCAPGGLCDAVRAAVVSVGRRENTIFELEVDAFSW